MLESFSAGVVGVPQCENKYITCSPSRQVVIHTNKNNNLMTFYRRTFTMTKTFLISMG